MKKAFGDWYYSLETSYNTKTEAKRDAKKFRESGKYYVRVARTGFGKLGHPWGIFLRRK